jgi:hypothetical protein
VPASGKLPFGRTFDAKAEKWGVDADKASMICDIATRYLAGESMSAMAAEYGINHSYLHKTINHRCGPVWLQTFTVPDLDIATKVETKVPPLLEPEVIAAIRKKATANRTYTHGEIKNRYMLSRMLFCAECGYAMTGQTNRNGMQCYRHRRNGGAEHCPLRPRPRVQAEAVERTVIGHLLDLIGNPVALARAVEDAAPKHPTKLRETEGRVTRQVAKLAGERQRIVRLIRKELISETEGDAELHDIKSQHDKLADKLATVQRKLDGHLTHEEATRRAKRLSARRHAILELASDPDAITYEDARALLADVFGGTSPGGQRMGVYVTPIDKGASVKNRRFCYELRGHLQDADDGVTCGTISSSHTTWSVPVGATSSIPASSFATARMRSTGSGPTTTPSRCGRDPKVGRPSHSPAPTTAVSNSRSRSFFSQSGRTIGTLTSSIKSDRELRQ